MLRQLALSDRDSHLNFHHLCRETMRSGVLPDRMT